MCIKEERPGVETGLQSREPKDCLLGRASPSPALWGQAGPAGGTGKTPDSSVWLQRVYELRSSLYGGFRSQFFHENVSPQQPVQRKESTVPTFQDAMGLKCS